MSRATSIYDVLSVALDVPAGEEVEAVQRAAPAVLRHFEKAVRWFYQNQPSPAHDPGSCTDLMFGSPLLSSLPYTRAIFEHDLSILKNLLVYFPTVRLLDGMQGLFSPSTPDPRELMMAFCQNLSEMRPLSQMGALVVRSPCNVLPEDIELVDACSREILGDAALRTALDQILSAQRDEQLSPTLSLLAMSYAGHGLIKPEDGDDDAWMTVKTEVVHALWQMLTSSRINSSWVCETQTTAMVARTLLSAVEGKEEDNPAFTHTSQTIELPDLGAASFDEIVALRSRPEVQAWHATLHSTLSQRPEYSWDSLQSRAASLMASLESGDGAICIVLDSVIQARDWMTDVHALTRAKSEGRLQTMRFLDMYLGDPSRPNEYPRRRWSVTPRLSSVVGP